VLPRPAQRRDQCVAGRTKLTLENLDRENVGGGRLFSNDRGDRCAVPKAIDKVVVNRTRRVDADSASHALNVRMGGVHAAVDDGDTHASPGSGSEGS
jgi:hypothetical protein